MLEGMDQMIVFIGEEVLVRQSTLFYDNIHFGFSLQRVQLKDKYLLLGEQRNSQLGYLIHNEWRGLTNGKESFHIGVEAFHKLGKYLLLDQLAIDYFWHILVLRPNEVLLSSTLSQIFLLEILIVLILNFVLSG